MYTLRNKILHCLEKYPSTRNSDIELTAKIWHDFHNSKIVEINSEQYIKINDLFELPREDHVKRIRAKIQNEEKKFLPLEKIAKQRELLREDWRFNMMPSNPSRY